MKVFLLTLAVLMTVAVVEALPGIPTTDGIPSIKRAEAHPLKVADYREFSEYQKIPIGFDALLVKSGAASNEVENLKWIFQQESGLCHMKWENTFTCPTEYPGDKYSPYDSTKGYGLCQATPAIKYAEMGADWRTNEVTQMKWCIKYSKSYGSVAQAVQFKKCMGSCYSPRTNSTVNKVTPWF